MDSESPEDSEDKDKAYGEIAAWVRKQYLLCKTARGPIQKKWEYQLLMAGGEQWAQLVGGLSVANGSISTPPAPKYRVRSTTNKLRSIVRMKMTRLNNQKPSATVVPVSSEDDDVYAAQGGQAVWESLYSRKRLHQLGIRASFWLATTGNSFRKTFWDADAIDRTFLTVDPMLQKPHATKGDIQFSVITPFNLFVPDLLEPEIENQPFIIEAYTKPVEWVNLFWKDKLKRPVTPNVNGKQEIFESSYFTAARNGGGGNSEPDSVLVLECWLKAGAHPHFPDGGMITLVGDQVIQCVKGMPYSHGEYPIAHAGDIDTGRFYRSSILEDAIPLQKEYNRTRSQIIESKIRTSRPQIAYFDGSIDPRRITSQAGLMIPVKPGFQMPMQLAGQPLPQYVLEELNTIQRDLEDMTGQHAVSRGAGPGGGIVAATAINYLQEQDDSLDYVAYASDEAALEKMARHALSLAADFWELPKIIRTTGMDMAFDAVELKGADIANGLDIRMEAGSNLPTSKAARQALLMEMAKMGMISPEQFIDLLQIGGIDKLRDLIKVDKTQAERENLKMAKLDAGELEMTDLQYEMSLQPDETGMVDPNTMDDRGMTLQKPLEVPVNDFDNHMVHIEVHNRFRKSQKFEQLEPRVREEFAKHVTGHQVMLMMQQGGMAGMGGGMPGEEGQPQPQMGVPGMMDESMAAQEESMMAPPEGEMMATGGGEENANQPNME